MKYFRTHIAAVLVTGLLAVASDAKQDANVFRQAVDRFVDARNNQLEVLPFLMGRADRHKNAEARKDHVHRKPLTPFERKIYAMTFEQPHTTVDSLIQVYGERLGGHFESLTGPEPLTDAPQQIHIGLAPQANNISVLWVTNTSSISSEVCWWPQGSPSLKQCASGESWTYDPISLIKWEGRIHGAYMSGLKAGSKVTYTVGDPSLKTVSAEITFTVPDLYKREIFVAWGGDMGTVQLMGWDVAQRMWQDYLNRTLEWDAFWLLGDLSYSTVDPPQDNFEFFWDWFMQQEQPLASKVPLLATYGNHDVAGGDSGAFINRYRNPSAFGGSGNFYWAYEHGPVKFISMCTEYGLNPAVCQYGEGTVQRAWLEKQLSNVDRARTPWVIVGGHRPMYSTDTGVNSGPLQADLDALFTKHKVDVALWGHAHCTEVTGPVSNFTVDMTGVTQTAFNAWTMNKPRLPVHLTVGTLGAIIDEKFFDPQPWSLYRDGNLWDPPYGYATLHATASSLTLVHLNLNNTKGKQWSVIINK